MREVRRFDWVKRRMMSQPRSRSYNTAHGPSEIIGSERAAIKRQSPLHAHTKKAGIMPGQTQV